MNFGRIITNDCVVTTPAPDTRCQDPAFALAHPDICPVVPQLILKPAVALLCQLRSVQLRAVVVENGTETDVTDETIFQSSNPNVAVVGALSGNATGLLQGNATLSGAYNGMTAFTQLTVLDEGCDCCENQNVAMMIVVDQSRSMSQSFNSDYQTKLHYARAAATRFISEVNDTKDLIGLMRFTEASHTVMSEPVSDKDTVEAMVAGILQTQQSTKFFETLETAIDELNAVETAERRVIILISDGMDQDTSYGDGDNPIALLEEFKSGGGIVICLGVRAAGRGYALLSNLATGGFFVNAYGSTAEECLDYLSGLKGYICAGNCTPVGDEFEPTGSLDFASFENWFVTNGHVDLVGNGFMDLLPGNGLYVDLAGSTSLHKGRMLLKDPLTIEAGKTYRVSFELAGNQRVDETPNTVEVSVFGRNNDGLSNPSVAPTVTFLGEGTGGTPLPLPETYRYAYSYMNEAGETALSPSETVQVLDEEDAVSVEIPPNTDATLVRLYRTTGESPESRYYLIAELAPEAPTLVDLLKKSEMLEQIEDGTIDESILAPEYNTTGTELTILSNQVRADDFRQDFTARSFNFTAVGDAEVFIAIQQIETPEDFDAIGLLLNSVTFECVTDGTVLFEDDFDGENLQYVPPRCGIGTTYLYEGFVTVTENVIPTMTSDTEPEGEASASGVTGGQDAYLAFNGSEVDGWVSDLEPEVYLQFAFDEVTVVTGWRFIAQLFGLETGTWTIGGSNNGIEFETIASGSIAAEQSGDFEAPVAYQYFRLTFSKSGSQTMFVPVWELFGPVDYPDYGYRTGYCCYGEGCLHEPPAAQLQDPNPQPDLEAGFTPPQEYQSTKTVCVECPEGLIDTDQTDLIPDMTSATTPSGVASANDEEGSGFAWRAFDGQVSDFGNPVGWQAADVSPEPEPLWLQYQFPAAVAVGAYAVRAYTPQAAPHQWIFQASNDGSTWVDLDSQANISWYQGERKVFKISNTTAYTRYRILVTLIPTEPFLSSIVFIDLLEMFGPQPATQVCATASAISEISQADADAQATAAARAAAEAQLNCQPVYSSTQCFTAHCAATAFGQPVTRCATRTSLVSQTEADTAALTAAQELAEAALDCTMSNNTQRIELPDKIGDDPTSAQPYPSVQYVEGLSGVIDKVVVNLYGWQHTDYSDIHMLLVSPEGTGVYLIGYVMAPPNPDSVEKDFIIDDDAADPFPAAPPAGAGPHTYQPTLGFPGVQIQPFNSPAPTPNPGPLYETALSALAGEDPNGSWSLWILDAAGADIGHIANGWDLTITLA